jgi:hypothetical protein
MTATDTLPCFEKLAIVIRNVLDVIVINQYFIRAGDFPQYDYFSNAIVRLMKFGATGSGCFSSYLFQLQND